MTPLIAAALLGIVGGDLDPGDPAVAALVGAPLDGSVVGRDIRHVGFGVADEATGDGRGSKRTATYPVTKLDPEIVWSGGPGKQTCSGDSGGPGLLDGELAAVVSDGPD